MANHNNKQTLGKIMKNIVLKMAICSVLGIFANQANAHTGVRDAAEEGKPSYNAFTITHGCGNSYEGGPVVEAYPVLGQSALFPMGDNVVWKDAKGKVLSRGGDGGVLAKSSKLSLSVTGYDSAQSAFITSEEIVDNKGVVHALHWKNGAMNPKSNTLTPFKITAPTIDNNCVEALKIRIGVINWCDIRKNAANDAQGPYLAPKDAFGRPIPIVSGVTDHYGLQRNTYGAKVFKTLPRGNGDNNRADWWFTAPDGGSNLYKDPQLLQTDYWTTLTVNNSAADLQKCTGTKTTVYVEPRGIDFDTYLRTNNTQPFTKGASNL